MSEDRKLIVKVRSLAMNNMLGPNEDSARMLSKAIDELCRAFEAAIDRGVKAEAAIHDLIKERQHD